MFSSDFGGDFSSGGGGRGGDGGVSKPPPPVNDIFSQAAASANGFPTIGTFSVDAPGGGGGNNSGGYNKDRNNHMKMKGEAENGGGMMFGEIGTFGQPNGGGAGAEGANAGTQETGIIEKLLVSAVSNFSQFDSLRNTRRVHCKIIFWRIQLISVN